MNHELDGLYRVRFATPLGNGTGVVVLNGGHANGGDSAMYYTGTYSVRNDKFTAKINLDRHTNDLAFESVFGVDRATINLEGSITTRTLLLTGSSSQAPNIKLSATMERLAN